MQKPSRLLFAGMLALLLAGIAPSAEAALNAYLTLTGQNQGDIPGEVTLAGKEDTIEITEYHHLVSLPTSGGTIVGPAQHEPLVFTAKLGRSTARLYLALDTAERVDGTIRFYRPNQVGQEIQYYTVVLTDARVTAIEPIKPDTRSPEAAAYPDLQRIRIIYRQMTVTYELDGSSHTMTVR